MNVGIAALFVALLVSIFSNLAVVLIFLRREEILFSNCQQNRSEITCVQDAEEPLVQNAPEVPMITNQSTVRPVHNATMAPLVGIKPADQPIQSTTQVPPVHHATKLGLNPGLDILMPGEIPGSQILHKYDESGNYTLLRNEVPGAYSFFAYFECAVREMPHIVVYLEVGGQHLFSSAILGNATHITRRDVLFLENDLKTKINNEIIVTPYIIHDCSFNIEPLCIRYPVQIAPQHIHTYFTFRTVLTEIGEKCPPHLLKFYNKE